MKVGFCIALIVFAIVAPGSMALGDSPTVKAGDGQPDGKKSLGGSGEMIEFVMPDEQSEVSGIRIHSARYGLPQAPNESFLIYFLSADESEVIGTELAPYALFDRGPEKWVEVKFNKSVKVPQKFWVAIDFRPGRTKGVYVSYDSSTDGKRSRIGLPGMESKPCDFAGDWMIEIVPAK